MTIPLTVSGASTPFELDSTRTLKIAGGLWLIYFVTLALLDSLLTRLPPEWRWYYIAHGLNALFFLGVVSWPGLRPRLGRWFMPLAIGLLSLLPILIDFTIVQHLPRIPTHLPEGLSIRLLPVLFLGLVLTAGTYSWRAVVGFCVGTAFLSALMAYFMRPTQPVPASFFNANLLLTLIRTVTFLLVGILIYIVVAQQKRQQADLELANAKLAHYAAAVERLAESRERNRVARELHDTLAHTLSGLTVQLETVSAYWEPDPATAQRMLGKALDTSRSGLIETRRALKALRASPVDDLGLLMALQRLSEQTAVRAPFEVNTDLPDSLPSLSSDVEQCIYRTAQEALANTVRHSEAKSVSLRLSQEPDGLLLTVQDDGRGFDLTQKQIGGHFGLLGMRERAALVSADVHIESQVGLGTRVTLKIKGQ